MTAFAPQNSRREFLSVSSAFATLPIAIMLNSGCGSDQPGANPVAAGGPGEDIPVTRNDSILGDLMQIQYLEIVTKDVEATIAIYSTVHGITFSEADATLGNARTSMLATGGMLGVRAPMHDGEKPVVRPYVLVKDIEAAAKAAEEAGAQIAVPPM